jgi:hypothetical protein
MCSHGESSCPRSAEGCIRSSHGERFGTGQVPGAATTTGRIGSQSRTYPQLQQRGPATAWSFPLSPERASQPEPHPNFSGLNCVRDLAPVARNLASVLTPGSLLFLYMLGRFAPRGKLWYLAHADWKTAFRTLRSKGGALVAAHVRKHPKTSWKAMSGPLHTPVMYPRRPSTLE